MSIAQRFSREQSPGQAGQLGKDLLPGTDNQLEKHVRCLCTQARLPFGDLVQGVNVSCLGFSSSGSQRHADSVSEGRGLDRALQAEVSTFAVTVSVAAGYCELLGHRFTRLPHEQLPVAFCCEKVWQQNTGPSSHS